jgi:hypothetical protein
MTISDNGEPNAGKLLPPRRTNRRGDVCPAFCTTDHSEMLIPGKPRFGYMDGHYSDPIHQPTGAPGAVRLARDPDAGTETAVSVDLAPGGAVRLSMSPEQAAALARVIEHDAKDPAGMLAAELRAAAAIARTVAP